MNALGQLPSAALADLGVSAMRHGNVVAVFGINYFPIREMPKYFP